MTEEEARATVATIAPEAMPLLERYAELLRAENANHNLIAKSTEATIWNRHLLDSLQLARFARPGDQSWLDVGSGAGLPGIVVAMLGRWRVTLVESRRKRVEFLRLVISKLGLSEVSLVMADVRTLDLPHDLISARAVASLSKVFAMTMRCSSPTARYILPKGRSALEDVDLAGREWQGVFHVEQSLTDVDAGIVIAERVRAR